MNLIDKLRSVFFGTQIMETTEAQAAANKMELTRFSILCAIGMIAGTTAKAEFNFLKNKELVRAEDWYRWNYEPNRNQNKFQFIYELLQNMFFQGAALIVRRGGEMFVADSYSRDTQGFYEDVFYDITKDGVTLQEKLRASEVLFFQYENAEMHTYLAGAVRQYAEMLDSAEQKFKKNNAQKGIFKLGTGVGGGEASKQNEKDQSYGAQIAKFLESDKSSVITLRKGVEYEELGKYHQSQSAEDISVLTKEIFTRTAEVFHIPAALLLGSGEATATKENIDEYIDFGIIPHLRHFETEITRKELRLDGIRKGIICRVDETPCRYVNPFTAAEAIDKLIASGAYNIDEIRRMQRREEIGKPWSRQHYLTRNYQPIVNAGKENAGKEE